MAEKTLLDSLATVLAVATVISKNSKKQPTVRRTRTARQVLDKHSVVTLYTVTETTTTHLK